MNKDVKNEYSDKIISTILSDNHIYGPGGGDLSIAVSLIRIKEMDVYVYGAGKNIWQFVGYLHNQEINVIAIIDKDIKKLGNEVYGVPIISTDDFLNRKRKNCFCFIYALIDGYSQMKILDMLQMGGISYYHFVSKQDRLRIGGVKTDWIDSDRIPYYISNKEKILKTVELLEDTVSLETLNEYLRVYIECDVYRLPQIKEKSKYFFDERDNDIYVHLENEVWMNVGANGGDTLFNYLQYKLKFKKIIAIEGSVRIFNKLCDSITMLPEKLQKKIMPLNMFIDDNSDINKILGDDKLTLINADIEGYELTMLKILKDIIQRDRPVVAVCVYHKKEDIVDIPQYIASIVDDYCYYLRKYECFYKDSYELVLYAVPKERRFQY